VGPQDAILLYQMTGSRQSIARNGMTRRSLHGQAESPAPVKRSHAARGNSPGMRPVMIFAHLLSGFIRPLLVAQMVVQLAAVPVSRTARAANDQSEGSGLPLPRFASLKSDHVNVRGGPNKDHDVAWIYTRPALPVEITAEYENWRRIRDRDGTEGWVYHTLLSGKRTAYVANPKTRPDLVPLYEAADRMSPLRAMLEPGVLGTVKRCNGQWCRFAGNGFDGWIEQGRLWGVYPNEKVE
jgi:SH3-like domain-containing protein